jgi:hypothetical protein
MHQSKGLKDGIKEILLDKITDDYDVLAFAKAELV